jgi:hypothetical protein
LQARVRWCGVVELGVLVEFELHLQIGVLLVWERHVGSSLHLFLVLLEDSLVDLDFWGCKGRCCDELKGLITDKLSGEPASLLLVSASFVRESYTYRKGFSKL